MKLFVAVGLAIISFVTAESPAFQKRSNRQTSPGNAPYPARGWRPNGQQFSLPQRQVAPNSYAAPQQEYGPPQTDAPETTTQLVTTTTAEIATESSNFDIQAENIALPPKKPEKKSAKLEEPSSPNKVYVFIPQSPQKLVLAPSARLVAQPQALRPAPVQAVPALAKIQAPEPVAVEQYPQLPQIVQFQNLQSYPLGYYSQNTVLTPYSSSFVQIYQ